ncbi:hypothetical protein [Aquirufa ecclesiirivi]|uniref:hypothetical protein n=1 Tax=Aquirufa ecclesiirivi TaxID=2715124 RepID=UPI0023D7E088|nr:hypothetical protein [Aquirufa ecclesiirivi]MDF0693240.1 hypothetical protein [Aquirufa ecclesiirivi]
MADETGSHLIPHLLLKRVVNVSGKVGRDQEMGFNLETTTSMSSFGRAVSPEKLKKLYGELSDEEIENNKDLHVVDNYFCKDCEKRLATIEGTYSNVISSSKSISKGLTALLFWTSIFWRMSISKKYGQFLLEEHEEKLRIFLNKYLSKDISKVPNYLNETQINEFKISYKIVRCNNYSGNNPTHILFHPEFFFPYTALIDEFIVALSFDEKYEDFEKTDFFGIQDEVLKSKDNNGSKNEEISQIETKSFNSACNGVIDKIKRERVDFIEEVINAIAKDLGYGDTMPENLRELIFIEITSEAKPLARKYTFEDMQTSIFQVLSKNPPPSVKI